jgi:hypothetical protein
MLFSQNSAFVRYNTSGDDGINEKELAQLLKAMV